MFTYLKSLKFFYLETHLVESSVLYGFSWTRSLIQSERGKEEEFGLVLWVRSKPYKTDDSTSNLTNQTPAPKFLLAPKFPVKANIIEESSTGRV
jgi:hypothetical protein